VASLVAITNFPGIFENHATAHKGTRLATIRRRLSSVFLKETLMKLMGNRVFPAVLAGIVLLGGVPAFAQNQALVDKGMKTFTAQKCSMCHSVAGKGNPKGPLDEAVATLTADDVRKWLTTPVEMASAAKAERKPAMKSFATLPKDDLDALVAYVLSLKKK
jgi:mono/diheme cytochrome c family protein